MIEMFLQGLVSVGLFSKMQGLYFSALWRIVNLPPTDAAKALDDEITASKIYAPITTAIIMELSLKTHGMGLVDETHNLVAMKRAIGDQEKTIAFLKERFKLDSLTPEDEASYEAREKELRETRPDILNFPPSSTASAVDDGFTEEERKLLAATAPSTLKH